MASIFTRKAVGEIMSNADLDENQRTEQIMGLWGRALDDGYMAKSAAAQAQAQALESAKAEWEKGYKAPDPKESAEYKELAKQYGDYKAMQTARTSEDFSAVKPKFFETVYNMVDRKDGAKPVKEQLEAIQKDYDEYFVSAHQEAPKKTPQFSQQSGHPGTNETSAEDKLYKQLADAWK